MSTKADQPEKNMKDTEETISYKLKIFSSATASKTCTLKISPKTSLKSVRSFLPKYSDYSFYFEDQLFINQNVYINQIADKDNLVILKINSIQELIQKDQKQKELKDSFTDMTLIKKSDQGEKSTIVKSSAKQKLSQFRTKLAIPTDFQFQKDGELISKEVQSDYQISYVTINSKNKSDKKPIIKMVKLLTENQEDLDLKKKIAQQEKAQKQAKQIIQNLDLLQKGMIDKSKIQATKQKIESKLKQWNKPLTLDLSGQQGFEAAKKVFSSQAKTAQEWLRLAKTADPSQTFPVKLQKNGYILAPYYSNQHLSKIHQRRIVDFSKTNIQYLQNLERAKYLNIAIYDNSVKSSARTEIQKLDNYNFIGGSVGAGYGPVSASVEYGHASISSNQTIKCNKSIKKNQSITQIFYGLCINHAITFLPGDIKLKDQVILQFQNLVENYMKKKKKITSNSQSDSQQQEEEIKKKDSQTKNKIEGQQQMKTKQKTIRSQKNQIKKIKQQTNNQSQKLQLSSEQLTIKLQNLQNQTKQEINAFLNKYGDGIQNGIYFLGGVYKNTLNYKFSAQKSSQELQKIMSQETKDSLKTSTSVGFGAFSAKVGFQKKDESAASKAQRQAQQKTFSGYTCTKCHQSYPLNYIQNLNDWLAIIQGQRFHWKLIKIQEKESIPMKDLLDKPINQSNANKMKDKFVKARNQVLKMIENLQNREYFKFSLEPTHPNIAVDQNYNLNQNNSKIFVDKNNIGLYQKTDDFYTSICGDTPFYKNKVHNIQASIIKGSLNIILGVVSGNQNKHKQKLQDYKSAKAECIYYSFSDNKILYGNCNQKSAEDKTDYINCKQKYTLNDLVNMTVNLIDFTITFTLNRVNIGTFDIPLNFLRNGLYPFFGFKDSDSILNLSRNLLEFEKKPPK